MSVASKNPFDLLGDDGEESPAPAAAPKKAAAPAAKADAPARTVPGATQAPRGGAGGRGGRGRGDYPARGGRSVTNDQPRNTGPTSGDGVAEGFETPGGFDGERVAQSKRFHKGPDAHTKGPRGSRPNKTYVSGGHTAREGDHTGRPRNTNDGGERRQYERRSGTVGGDSQKKIDLGWGANEGNAELTAEVEGEKDAQKEEAAPGTPAAEGAAEGDDAAATTAAAAAPEEEEDNTKSYDQYLAEKAAAAADFGKKEGRKVTGETLEGKAFRREEVNDFFNSSKKETAAKPKTAAPKKEKVYIPVDGQFATPPGGSERGGRGGSRGGDRGGRGSGRGTAGGERGRGFGGERGRGAGRGRGAPRTGRGGFGGQTAAVDANDEKAFPALGA